MEAGRLPRIVVLGSVHMDLIATADRLPGPGESVAGGTFSMGPGGKAGNQAVQFSLCGAETAVLTRLGDDNFGRELLNAIKSKGVDTSAVAIDRGAATGASTVFAAHGDYCSIIAPGAAARLSIGGVEQARAKIEAADALALQLELPPEISDFAAQIASARRRMVILNASPAPPSWSAVPETLWRAVSVLVLNRVEAASLLGEEVSPGDLDAALAGLAEKLSVATIVVTLGADGIAAFSGGRTFRQPAFPAAVVDAVGAGDAFLGTFCTALIEGAAMPAALRRGAAAGALAVSRRGVYDALPTRAEVDAFLARADLRPGSHSA